MALRLEDKKQLVKEVNAVAGDSVTAVAAEYRGLSVAEMTELRKEARNAGVYMRVVKNTLARRAVEGTDFECMQETLKGPILLFGIYLVLYGHITPGAYPKRVH